MGGACPTHAIASIYTGNYTTSADANPETDLRDVLDALRYLARTGGGWRMFPNDFPPWQTVYWWFRRFVRRLLFRTIHDVTLMLDREQSLSTGTEMDTSKNRLI